MQKYKKNQSKQTQFILRSVSNLSDIALTNLRVKIAPRQFGLQNFQKRKTSK
ncbi:unnamed protein product [Paramecium octaurelia]|uniref:Uncharacterized protein n=1 Tax=Paramecium octaurelia TaxID=43137 RepID=A0A8S1V451_PAROT|nr:unnamed protein product [Paramecium octaurelia]